MKQLSPTQKQQGFRTHAMVFVAVMAVLIVVNLWTGAPYWFLYVLLAWGIGLLAHWYFGSR